MNNLACFYLEGNRRKKAEELHLQMLGICQRLFGAEHPDTLASMRGLAIIWESCGRIDDAIKLMEECFEGYSRVLG
ncbi:hypothetical protein M434DRAFT_50965, partial [Hypoxylon sp. CO27-5]